MFFCCFCFICELWNVPSSVFGDHMASRPFCLLQRKEPKHLLMGLVSRRNPGEANMFYLPKRYPVEKKKNSSLQSGENIFKIKSFSVFLFSSPPKGVDGISIKPVCPDLYLKNYCTAPSLRYLGPPQRLSGSGSGFYSSFVLIKATLWWFWGSTKD